MKVSREDVAKIAGLARLRPDDDAVERLAAELSHILDYVQVLEQVELHAEGADYMEEADSSLIRPESVGPDPLAEGAPASLAPAWHSGFFTVPRLAALDEDGGGA